MGHPYWPLFDLRLRTGDLELRPMTEADQPALADLLPDDLELDPSATTYDFEPRVGRGVVTHQAYWRAYGTWSPAHWRLNFLVLSRRAGWSEPRSSRAPTSRCCRTVDTASFLVPEARGRGIGKAMRSAVLALAFEGLDADAAITSAWHDNDGSLGVSRSLGYRPNGEHLHAPRGRRRRA